jgi:AraC-like DNA-binding protein
MLAEGVNASHAAYAVGYESVQQFTREYGRMFGKPPMRDVAEAQQRLDAA